MEDRMQFGDLITSENINDETTIIIRDYLTMKTGDRFDDHILAYENRAVYCFQVFPHKNEIVVELAGKWNMPEYYEPKKKYFVVVCEYCDTGFVCENSGIRHKTYDDAREEISDVMNLLDGVEFYIKEVEE